MRKNCGGRAASSVIFVRASARGSGGFPTADVCLEIYGMSSVFSEQEAIAASNSNFVVKCCKRLPSVQTERDSSILRLMMAEALDDIFVLRKAFEHGG